MRIHISPNGDRTPIMDDHELDHWAERYQSLRLDDYGISFELFLENPVQISETYEGLLDAFRPLLPAQRVAAAGRAAMELERSLDELEESIERLIPQAAELRGDRMIEPLHHHSYKTTRRKDVPNVARG